MLSSVFEVLTTSANADEAFLGKDASGQSPTVYAPRIQTNRVLVLLQATVGVMSKVNSLGTIP